MGAGAACPRKLVIFYSLIHFALLLSTTLLKKIYMLFFLTSGVGGCNLQQIFKGVGRAAD